MTFVSLSIVDLVLAAVLILLNGALSLAFGLGLERRLAFTTVRMVVQLAAIGFVLKFIFQQSSPLWTLMLAVVMVGVAGHELLARQKRRIGGWYAYVLSVGTLSTTGLLATLYGVAVILGPEPWYAPRYVLPILGMVLGNTLTGASLALDALTSGATRERAAIEARLALGATRLQALSGVLSDAVRTGTMPLINSMAASGIVSLPGMMTGQILAGIDPVEAAKYQIMIMFVLAGATALGVLLAAFGGVVLITDDRHRLRLDRLKANGP